MKFKVEQINKANASITTTIPGDELKKAEEKVAKSFAQKARIDGFRVGKVPVSVIKSRYAKEIKQEAEQEILKKVFDDGIKDLGKKPEEVVGEPIFKKFERKEDGIEADITISFRPEVKTKGYEECIPSHSTPRVTKKDVEERKANLLSMVAPLKPIKQKRGLKKGDFALFDFEGFVDGKTFEGGKAQNYTLEIGSGQFIPGFEDGMLGLKAGESKDVNVTFPKGYGSNDLAGKDAIFKVSLHEIQSKEIPAEPSEEMIKRLLPNEENASVEKLEEQIKEQVRLEKLNKIYEEDLKPKFIESIIEKLEFDLPENIVEQELDMQMRQNWGTFSKEEVEKFQSDPKSVQEKREEFREDAIKSVKLTFIVDELARENQIAVDDQEVMQKLYFEAMQQGQEPKAYVEMYEKQGVLPAVKMSMIEDKLFRTLFFENKKESKKAPKKATK